MFLFKIPGRRRILRYFKVTGILFFSVIPANLHAMADEGGFTRIPVSLLHFLLTMLVLLAALLAVVWFFSSRLRRLHSELKAKNSENERINRLLSEQNEHLSSHNDRISRDLNHSEKFFSTLIDSADDGISYYDRDWNLKYANNAFYSMIGTRREDYSAADPATIVHPEDIQYISKRASELLTKGYFEGEIRLKHSGGHYVFVSTKSVLIKDDSGIVLGSLTISRDISALRKYHQELVQAKVEAETSNKLKASFLANISHEIRTPLNSVVGFANLLMAEDVDPQAKAEYVDHINFNSEKLLQIIGDIIDLSRLESSQIEITYEETSLSEIVNEVVDETRRLIKRNEKPIILIMKNQFENHSDLIFTDRVWLKRVLNHLMDNAVKFTLEGSVEFSFRKDEDNILFKVKDTGIGIKKENLTRIFEEFRQEIDGHHRPFEGLGVGLTLAREVIGKMGGKISVESEKGIGSEFSFTIPYRPAGSRKVRNGNTESSFEPSDWSTMKCLVVDDNKDVLIYLNRILVDTGMKVIMARSGEEALGIIEKTPDIDMVLLDMQMPEMNGIEVTREIRKVRGNIPIIAQTAFVYEDDKDIILEAGCDACLIKPIRKDHLLTVISGFVNR